jgi:D-alanyl-D-alanine carboxypeptidase/D-alanyl-D-alanine-endopeptidase (penicillin-binding protein 4)
LTAWLLAGAALLGGAAGPKELVREGHAEETPRPTASAQTAAPVADVQRLVDRLAKDVGELGGRLSATVVDVSSGRVVAENAGHTRLNPASNQKLLTAALALDRLGSEHEFTTSLLGELRDGRVGELVLRGRFDPTLDAARLRGLVEEIRRRGVRSVGAVLVDQEGFEGPYVPPAFEQQPNEWAAFRAPVAPTSYERNTLTFWFAPGAEGAPVEVLVDPPGIVSVEGSVSTSKKGAGEKIKLTLSSRGGAITASLGGSFAAGSAPLAVARRADDPSLLGGHALSALLAERGIRVEGSVRAGSSPRAAVLASSSSASVGELLSRLGKDSDNFTAEMLFLAAGAAGERPSFDRSREAARALLAARGVPTEEWSVTNGSGLFRANEVSSFAMAKLLREEVHRPRTAPETLSHLAIGGVDGTLKNRLKKLASSRVVRAKTGTLADTVALSGYVLDSSGAPRFSFSFLTAGVKGHSSDAREAIDRAVVDLAQVY